MQKFKHVLGRDIQVCMTAYPKQYVFIKGRQKYQ